LEKIFYTYNFLTNVSNTFKLKNNERVALSANNKRNRPNLDWAICKTINYIMSIPR